MEQQTRVHNVKFGGCCRSIYHVKGVMIQYIIHKGDDHIFARGMLVVWGGRLVNRE